MPLQKMGPQDDPEAFLDLFEKTAEACGWPQMNWPVRLISLLSGEVQLAAKQLPVQNLLVYDDLKRAILQRVGRNPEQHRQRFRSLELGENGRPFVMAHQLRDACRRWPLSPLSKEKSAFTTPFGLHQFVTLPFGLFGAPATFQRLMDKILRPHTAYAAAYLDDIIIYSQDWQRHMVHLREVLRALRGAGLTANPKKCAIGWVEVRYLGFH